MIIVICGQRPSILDLVFTDDSDSIDCIQHYPPLGSSDHDCLVFQYKCYEMCPSSDDVSYKYGYWKGNYVAICKEVDAIDWDILLQHYSIETNWIIFRNLVLSLVEKYVPKATKKAETSKPPWWSSQLTKAIKEKKNLYSQYKFTRSPLDYAKYASKRNNVKVIIRTVEIKHDESLIQKFNPTQKSCMDM